MTHGSFCKKNRYNLCFHIQTKKIDNFDEEDNWQPWDERDGSDCQCTNLPKKYHKEGKRHGRERVADLIKKIQSIPSILNILSARNIKVGPNGFTRDNPFITTQR